MSDGQKPVRWESWHAAFEEAGRLAAQDRPKDAGAPIALRLVLTPADFYTALSGLRADSLNGMAAGDPRYQEACRTGALVWWDARGRCVIIIREGSLKRAGPEGRIVMPPGLEDAEVGSIGHAGNLKAQSPHPIAEALDGPPLIGIQPGAYKDWTPAEKPAPLNIRDRDIPAGLLGALKPKGKKK